MKNKSDAIRLWKRQLLFALFLPFWTMMASLSAILSYPLYLLGEYKWAESVTQNNH